MTRRRRRALDVARGLGTAIVLSTAVAGCGGDPSGASRIPEPARYGYPGAQGELTAVGDGTPLPPGAVWDEASRTVVVTGLDVVLEGLFVRGSIDHQSAGQLTILDSVVEGGPESPFVVVSRERGARLIVKGTTLRRREPSAVDGTGAIQVLDDVQVVAEGNDISGTADGIQLTGDSSRVVGNRIHDLATTGGLHNDGVQVYSGDDVVISGNVFEIPQGATGNAAVFVQAGPGASVTGLRVTENSFDGAGYALTVEGSPDQVAGVVVTDNRWSGHHRWGPVFVQDPTVLDEWRGNDIGDSVLASP